MKKNKTIFWVATAIIILWEGAMPLYCLLFAPEQVTVGTRPLGYPDYFAFALVIAKVLGVLAIAIPAVPAVLREWAYAGLAFNMIFGFISHAVVSEEIGFMIMPLAVLAILFTSYVFGKKIRARGGQVATAGLTR